MRDITLEDTFYHQFTTRAFATGIPTQLAGAPVLSVLEENNATPITAGVSVSVDRATVTGLNEATIVATAANGYEAGKSYSIYISTGTVGGVSVVGEVVGQFTIQKSAAAVDLANATDGLSALKTLIDTAQTELNKIGTIPALDGAAQTIGAAIAKLADDNGGADFDAGTDSLQEIRDHATTIKAETVVLNAFWNVFILTVGTIGATGNDTTHLHLTGQAYGDDELNDYLIVTYDVSNTRYHSSWILDWDNASALATVATLPYTPQASTDQYWIFSIRKHPDDTTTLTNLNTLITTVGAAGAGLTAINLPNQTMDITGNITGNLIGDVTGNVDGTVAGVTPEAAGVAPTATEIVDEFETQSQADPTGFHVNVKEVNGTAQTANDNGAGINKILGLSHENIYIDNPVFDNNANLTSARVRTYSVAASVGTDSDVLATYTITSVGSGQQGIFTTWKQVAE